MAMPLQINILCMTMSLAKLLQNPSPAALGLAVTASMALQAMSDVTRKVYRLLPLVPRTVGLWVGLQNLAGGLRPLLAQETAQATCHGDGLAIAVATPSVAHMPTASQKPAEAETFDVRWNLRAGLGLDRETPGDTGEDKFEMLELLATSGAVCRGRMAHEVPEPVLRRAKRQVTLGSHADLRLRLQQL